MKIYDSHTHSKFSIDGKDEAGALCASANEKGFAALAMTEHFDLGDEGFSGAYYLKHEPDRKREMERLKRAYEEKFDLLYGIEIGEPQLEPDKAREFLAARRFDVVLGSVHILSDARDIYFVDYIGQDSIDTMFFRYFSDMEKMIEFGGFDVLAHLDYPLRVIRKDGFSAEASVRRYEEQVERVLKKLADRGMGLEINARGLMDWQGRVGPEPWVLRRFFELGGETITFGSDSHRADVIGFGQEEQRAAAKKAGFSHVTFFKDRKPIKVAIE